MYIRFAGLDREPSIGVAPGLFWVSAGLPRDADWRHEEAWRLLDWFNLNLDAPLCVGRKSGRGGWRQGVCWFRDTATLHVSQARYLAWLLTEIGRPVRELRAACPGAEIWRDDHQAVFVPYRERQVRVL